MSVYIDKKFISFLSPKLQRFKQKSEYLWNFKCLLCGDSKKNKTKCRGYIYQKKSNFFFTCHNCHAGMSLGNFIKTVDPALYSEYQLETYKEQNGGNVKAPDFEMAKTKPVFAPKSVQQDDIKLPTVASLPEEHTAKRYMRGRKFPNEVLNMVYYATDFKSFVQEILPANDKKMRDKESRIVIPFYDKDKKLLGFQGRAMSATDIKYITIKMGEDNAKVFGLDRVDLGKKVYVVEGPLDSFFLQNCLATMDSALYNITLTIGNEAELVFIYDNEPKNDAIVKFMRKTIDLGKNIFIWPKELRGVKDINDAIMSGTTPAEMQNLIDKNTWNGLRAELEFGEWKK